MNNSNAKKPDAKKIVKIVLNVLLWVFLIFAFLMMVFAFASVSNDYGVPIMGNKIILTVASDSMKPIFEKGDLIVGTVLSDEEKAQLKPGDIITYFVDLNGDGTKELNTHKIDSILLDGTIKTRGENKETNQTVDSYNVYQKDVVCIWHEGDTHMKGIGKIFAFLQSRVGFLCVVVIPLALFFIYEVIRFVLTIVKIKGGNKKEITEEDKEEIARRAVEEYLRQKESEAEKASAAQAKPEEPKPEEPKPEEPKAEEPKAEEPKATSDNK